MATGRLGAVNISSADTDTTLYTVPGSTKSVVNVSLCNRNTSAVKARLAFSASGTPTTAEYLEYDTEIPANSVLERTGIIMDAGKYLVVRSDTTNVSAVAWGIEEAA